MSNRYLRGQISPDPFVPDTTEWTVNDQFVHILKREDLYHSLEPRNVAIVTGANRGLGKQIAKQLAQRGSTVIMACRNMKKCQDAKNEILEELNSLSSLLEERKQIVKNQEMQKDDAKMRLATDPDEALVMKEAQPDEYNRIFQDIPPLDYPFDGSSPTRDINTSSSFQRNLSSGTIPIICKELRLDSFDSIRKFSSDIHSMFDSVHLLVNNAGTSPWEAGHQFLATQDINEWHFQINFLGPYLLSNLLLDLMLDNKSLLRYGYDQSKIKPNRHIYGTRIINIGDGIYHRDVFSFGDLQSLFSYTSADAYFKAKLDLEVWGMYFDRCLRFTNLSVNNVLPLHFVSDRRNRNAVYPFEVGASTFQQLKNQRFRTEKIRPSALRYQDHLAQSESTFSVSTITSHLRANIMTRLVAPKAESVSTNLVMPVILSTQLDGYGGRNYTTSGPFISPITLGQAAYSFDNAEHIVDTATNITKLVPEDVHGLFIPKTPRPKQIASQVIS